MGDFFQNGRIATLHHFRIALEQVEQYDADAISNGRGVDRHQEEALVDLFAPNIYRAGEAFLSNPMPTPFVPRWDRVPSARPDLAERFQDALEQDNRQAGFHSAALSTPPAGLEPNTAGW